MFFLQPGHSEVSSHLRGPQPVLGGEPGEEPGGELPLAAASPRGRPVLVSSVRFSLVWAPAASGRSWLRSCCFSNKPLWQQTDVVLESFDVTHREEPEEWLSEPSEVLLRSSGTCNYSSGLQGQPLPHSHVGSSQDEDQRNKDSSFTFIFLCRIKKKPF